MRGTPRSDGKCPSRFESSAGKLLPRRPAQKSESARPTARHEHAVRTLLGLDLAPVCARVTADGDGDGLPDGWESANGYNPALTSDGVLDADGDGADTRSEFVAGTSPSDAADVLRGGLVVAAPPGGTATLRFIARADRAYAVQRKTSALDPVWITLATLPARPHVREESVEDPAPGSGAIYRVVTPPAP